MFKDMRIAAKLRLITVALVLGMAAITAASLYELRQELLADREEKVKNLVETATGLVRHYHDRARAGDISEEAAKRAALAAIGPLRYQDGDYFWVHDMNHVVLVHPTESLIGENVADLKDPEGVPIFREFNRVVAADGAGFVPYMWPKPGAEEPVAKISYVAGFEPWGWVVGTGIYIDDVNAIFWNRAAIFGGIVLVVALLVGSFATAVGRGISRPLAATTDQMLKLADGDLAITVTGAEREDEIGALARALDTFHNNARERDRLAAEQQAEQERKAERQQRLEGLARDFDESARMLLQSVSVSIQHLHEASETLSGGARETSERSTNVAAAAEQATNNVQTVASAAEELSSSIQEISRQVSQSSRIAGEATAKADQTNQTIRGLAEAAQRIGEVVTLITDIAEQTNLLALNATIEAARAGDAGKGFAVVANEVKNLATQTGKATEDISRQIAAVQAETESAVTAIDDIARVIGDMNEISTSIASAVEEQGAATQEIARNVQEAAAGTDQVSENIQGVSSAADETGRSAQMVFEAAAELRGNTDALRQKVEAFLKDIRDA